MLTALPNSFVVWRASIGMITMKILTNVETAELLGLKPNTLERWRLQGRGPTFRKLGRAVRYVEADVLAWLDAQSRRSTSQEPNEALRARSR